MMDGILFDNQGEADQYIQRRVCARCYADLMRKPVEDRLWAVSCPTCGDAWGNTTVARITAEKRGQQALAELYETRQNLKDILPSPVKGKTEQELLNDLGF